MDPITWSYITSILTTAYFTDEETEMQWELIPSQEPGLGYFVCRALCSTEPHTHCGLGCHLRSQPHGDSPTNFPQMGLKIHPSPLPHPIWGGIQKWRRGLFCDSGAALEEKGLHLKVSWVETWPSSLPSVPALGCWWALHPQSTAAALGGREGNIKEWGWAQLRGFEVRGI